MSVLQIKEQIDNHKLISFDFFYDTLCYRIMPEPEVVFDLVGLKHRIPDFRALRQQAQTLAFQRMLAAGRKEITLADIYDGIQVGGSSREELLESELAFERALTRPSAAACALFEYAKAAGKRVVVVSDMYLPGYFIAGLCRDFGLDAERVFVSSDCNATKRDTGELYHQVAAAMGVAPADIAHIGDNYVSDVQRAQSRGLTGIHYCPVDIRHRYLAHTPVTAVLEELLKLEVKQHGGATRWKRPACIAVPSACWRSRAGCARSAPKTRWICFAWCHAMAIYCTRCLPKSKSMRPMSICMVRALLYPGADQ